MQLHLGLHAGGSLIQTCISHRPGSFASVPVILLQHIPLAGRAIVQRIIFPGGALTVGQVPALRISRLSNLFLHTACVWLVNRGPILSACFRIQWWGCTTTVTSQLTSSQQSTSIQPISLPLEPVDPLRNELITFWSLVLWQSAGVRHLQGIIHRVETGAVGASP